MAPIATPVSTRSALTGTSSLSAPGLSAEQLAIALFIKDQKGNLLVVARAGTGKTYLIIKCLPLMSGTIAIAAYNRKIATEIRAKVQTAGLLRSNSRRDGVDVGTFHSYGMNALRAREPNLRLEGRDKDQAGFFKIDVIAERLEIPPYLKKVVRKTIDRAQERLFGVIDPRTGKPFIAFSDKQAWLDLGTHYSLEDELPDDNHIEMQLLRAKMGFSVEQMREELMKRVYTYAAKGIQLSIRMAREEFNEISYVGRGETRRQIKGKLFPGVISFGEMLYLPLYFNLPIGFVSRGEGKNAVISQYDWVCTDEAQDSNPARREMARRMIKPGGRAMFVGDNRQAINGWAGADNDALEQIAKDYACTTFPMTVTFRCGKAIVALAQRLVPDYKAAETNPEGLVRSVTEDQFYAEETPVPGEDAIICRSTAPLVKTAYKLLGKGISCHVEGKDIGRGLTDLIYRWPHLKNVAAYLSALDEYVEREVAKLNETNQEAAVESLTDKVESIKAICEGMPKGSKLADIQARVDSLFADTKDGKSPDTVTLMTAHRSKGLEYKRVYGLGVNKYMPSKFAKTDWAMIQEENLEYVLYTRAIHEYCDIQVP